ncbi:MAG: hypothetical protein JWO67_2257, partial [Streptosporangiaceae bacterium]|nr:hypothetical protein [Streptosporangiaceae bacterium]
PMDAAALDASHRKNWPIVHAALRCSCTDADPSQCEGSPDESGPQCQPAPHGRQCSCHHIHTEQEYGDFLSAVTARAAFDPEQVLRDYAASLIASTDPDANAWAAALLWAASRIHGGHQSIYAGRKFTARFGVHPYPGDPA